MEDDIRISDKDDSKFILKFAVVFFAFCLYMLFITSYSIVSLVMIIVAAFYFPYHLRKVKEIYFDGSSIYVKTKNGFESIGLDNITKASSRMVSSGYYKIWFRSKTKFGTYLMYAPRKSGRFSKYPLLKEFIKVANQENHITNKST